MVRLVCFFLLLSHDSQVTHMFVYLLLPPVFADVCHLSTDFHFSDIDMQLSQIQDLAQKAICERQDRKLMATSLSSQTSDSVISQNESASDTAERRESRQIV